MSGIPVIEPYPLPAAGDLPPGPVAWTPDPGRAVLLVHDMQRYFLRPVPEPLRGHVVRNAALLRECCAAAGVPVAYTAQPGDMSPEDRGLFRDFWGEGMTGLPEDRGIVDELHPEPDDWRFTKWRYSAFFRSDLLARLRAAGRDQLLLCGVYAHAGVLITAVEAFSNDVQTFLVADALGDFSADHHLMALTYAAEHCAALTTVKEVIGTWS
ncbi:isochorismatase family protein [Saccharothrix lopnurensis]|uniref:Isochorismatase family protein n=1 Tax=Saccharothrix lopnurensis TaxID=1670621 RepID=A0ABW1NXF1_9PSEU